MGSGCSSDIHAMVVGSIDKGGQKCSPFFFSMGSTRRKIKAVIRKADLVIVDNEETQLEAYHLANNNTGTVVRLIRRISPHEEMHLLTWDDLLEATVVDKGYGLRLSDGREVSFFKLAPLSFA